MPSPKRPRNVPESASSSSRPERRRDIGVVRSAVNLPLASGIRLLSASTGPLRRVRGGSFHHRIVSWLLVAFEGHLVSPWNATAKIGQPRRSHPRVSKRLGDVTDRVFGCPTGVPRRDLAMGARLRAAVPLRGDTRTDQPRGSHSGDRRHRQDNAPTVGPGECVRGPRSSHCRCTIPSRDTRRRDDRVAPRHPSNLGSPTEFRAPGVPTA
jgi:hypothetical protein